jgi:hypothetical protein
MARCACGTGTCSCVVKAAPDGGVTVVGNGSPTRPYLIGVPGGNPLLNLEVVDSPTLDLTISGGGTATDKRKIQGQATQSLTNLKDVQGTPIEGEIPVWRTNHWEFEAAAAAGLPVSGSWGTPPLDAYGSDSKIGRQIYLDVDSKLRAQPEQVSGRLPTDLAALWPAGTSIFYIPSGEGALWPGGSIVVTHKTTNNVIAQWCYLWSAVHSRAWFRNGTSTGWSPWALAGADIHYSASTSTPHTMATANAFYTATFENVEANVGGITYSAGVFTIPVDGSYLVNFSSHIQNTLSSTSVTLNLLKNGVTAADHVYGTTNTNKNWSLSRMVRCAAGDTLSLRAKVSVANANFYGSTGTKYTYMDIAKVGG